MMNFIVLELGGANGILESTLLICTDGLNNSDVPPCEEPEPVEVQKEEGSPILVNDGLSFQDVQTEEFADCHDDLETLFADILVADIYNVISPLQQFTPSTSLDIKSSMPFETAGVKPSMGLDEVNSEQQLDFASADVQAFPQAENIQSSPVAPPINSSFGIWEKNPDLQLGEANIEPPVPLASADFHTPPQRENVGSPPLVSRVRSNSSIWKRRGKSASVQVRTDKSRQKRSEACCTGLEIGMESNESIRSKSHLRGLIEGAGLTEDVFFTPYEEIRDPEPLLVNKVLKQQDSEKINHGLRLKSLLSSTDEEEEEEEGEEAYTPDKENMTPNTHLLYSRKKMGKLDDIDPPKSYSRSSPLKNVGPNACTEVCMPVLSESRNHSSTVHQEMTCDSSGSNSLAKSEGDILKATEHRMPFQSALANSNKTKSEAVDVGGTSNGYESSVDMQVKDSIHPF